jgi:hypothetical protein
MTEAEAGMVVQPSYGQEGQGVHRTWRDRQKGHGYLTPRARVTGACGKTAAE